MQNTIATVKAPKHSAKFVSVNPLESKAVVRIISTNFTKPMLITLVTNQKYNAYFKGSYMFGKIPFYAFFYKDTMKIKFPTAKDLSFNIPRQKARGVNGVVTIEREYTKGITQAFKEVKNIVRKIGADKIVRGDSELYNLYKEQFGDIIEQNIKED